MRPEPALFIGMVKTTLTKKEWTNPHLVPVTSMGINPVKKSKGQSGQKLTMARKMKKNSFAKSPKEKWLLKCRGSTSAEQVRKGGGDAFLFRCTYTRKT
jgi:hypothetical protein